MFCDFVCISRSTTSVGYLALSGFDALFLAVFLSNDAAAIHVDILFFVSVTHVVENARLVDVDGGATVVCVHYKPYPSLSCTDVPSPIRSTTTPEYAYTPVDLLW